MSVWAIFLNMTQFLTNMTSYKRRMTYIRIPKLTLVAIRLLGFIIVVWFMPLVVVSETMRIAGCSTEEVADTHFAFSLIGVVVLGQYMIRSHVVPDFLNGI